MELTRRAFVAGLGGTTTASLLESVFRIDIAPARRYGHARPLVRGRITTTVCPFCSVGCGLLVTAADGRVVNVAGDPDHPINEGATCSKGAAVSQIATSERRLTRVLYRAPGTARWQERDWEWAVGRIARRIKDTREQTFVERDERGRVVNRTPGIASLGGAALDNEECYALGKLTRALGVIYLENHARL